MKKNIGTLDRIVRLLLGAIGLGLGVFVATGYIQIVLILAGMFCVFEAQAGWCVVYQLLGKNTCPIE